MLASFLSTSWAGFHVACLVGCVGWTIAFGRCSQCSSWYRIFHTTSIEGQINQSKQSEWYHRTIWLLKSSFTRDESLFHTFSIQNAGECEVDEDNAHVQVGMERRNTLHVHMSHRKCVCCYQRKTVVASRGCYSQLLLARARYRNLRRHCIALLTTVTI